jgi:hypothetical protein
MRTKIVKATALGLLLFCMCLFADIAYGMGGGGHHGDGRWDSPQPAAPASSNSTGSDAQQTPTGGYWGWSGSADVMCSGPYGAPITVPEPIAALLLGLGVIGLVNMRRRFSK